MRFVVAVIALNVALASCSPKSGSGSALGQLIADDPKVCVNSEVLKLLLTNTHAGYEGFLNKGGSPVTFTEVSASDANKSVHEVTCSAVLHANVIGGEVSGDISYKVRPSQDEGGGFLVAVLNSQQIKNTLGLHMAAWAYGKKKAKQDAGGIDLANGRSDDDNEPIQAKGGARATVSTNLTRPLRSVDGDCKGQWIYIPPDFDRDVGLAVNVSVDGRYKANASDFGNYSGTWSVNGRVGEDRIILDEFGSIENCRAGTAKLSLIEGPNRVYPMHRFKGDAFLEWRRHGLKPDGGE